LAAKESCVVTADGREGVGEVVGIIAAFCCMVGFIVCVSFTDCGAPKDNGSDGVQGHGRVGTSPLERGGDDYSISDSISSRAGDEDGTRGERANGSNGGIDGGLRGTRVALLAGDSPPLGASRTAVGRTAVGRAAAGAGYLRIGSGSAATRLEGGDDHRPTVRQSATC
jgi:hypothetical protein